MSLYRPVLAAALAFSLVLPAFADEIPATSTEPSAQSTEAQAPVAQQTKVDINKATVKELTQVKGISAAKAKAIVVYRKKNGDFKSLDDLKNVKGFKKMNVDQIKEIQDQLTTG